MRRPERDWRTTRPIARPKTRSRDNALLYFIKSSKLSISGGSTSIVVLRGGWNGSVPCPGVGMCHVETPRAPGPSPHRAMNSGQPTASTVRPSCSLISQVNKRIVELLSVDPSVLHRHASRKDRGERNVTISPRATGRQPAPLPRITESINVRYRHRVVSHLPVGGFDDRGNKPRRIDVA
jgi:hypothetical protein